MSHWSRKTNPKVCGTLKSLPKIISKRSPKEECVHSAKTAKCVASCVASKVLQVTDKLPSFPSKAQSSQIERQMSKPRCSLDRSWNRALANRSLPAQQSRHQDKNCVQLCCWARMKGSASSEGQNDNFFCRTKVFSKRQQHRLSLSCMHAKKWRPCGNHNYQKIRLECAQVAINRNRSMASQRVNQMASIRSLGFTSQIGLCHFFNTSSELYFVRKLARAEPLYLCIRRVADGAAISQSCRTSRLLLELCSTLKEASIETGFQSSRVCFPRAQGFIFVALSSMFFVLNSANKAFHEPATIGSDRRWPLLAPPFGKYALQN